MACDLADFGFTIEPVEIEYSYDTPFGRKCVTPFYFQVPVFCSLRRIEKFLGAKLGASDCLEALSKMGVSAEKTTGREKDESTEEDGLLVRPPEYRNDFLHAADVVEDVMMGRGITSFKPERPNDFTVGRLMPLTLFSRKTKELMTGLGYQEFIYNYLGSRKNFVEKMRGDDADIIRISNPMTENYEYVRNSILPSLLESEAVSSHAVYPHKIFEIGKVTYLDKNENYGAVTRHCLGLLHADRDANFNTLAAQIQTLFYYLFRDYKVEEKSDSRFIAGRCASLMFKDRPIGVFGELHPEVLENWDISIPCAAAEIDIEALV
jgi:phenylalanyl-tRNA synthetase beta chain